MPAMNPLEGIFVKMLSNYTVTQFRDAVNKNIRLRPLVTANPYINSLLPMARVFASLNKKYANQLTSNGIAFYLMDRRPDLSNEIYMNFKARQWLDFQISDMRNLFGL